MTVEFRPLLKKVTAKANGNVEVLLEISNSSLKGKSDDLNALLGATVTAQLRPESVSYKIPYDKESGLPHVRYEVDGSGIVQEIKEEQTALEVDGAPNFEERSFSVEVGTIDEFIMEAESLEFPGEINPRDVLCRLEEGEGLDSIAEDKEMSEAAILNELEKARNHYAPFAAAWSEKQKDSK